MKRSMLAVCELKDLLKENPMSDQTREIRELSLDEIGFVSGGWKRCELGTDAGGGPGLYPDYATCSQSMQEIIDGIVANVQNIVYGPRPR